MGGFGHATPCPLRRSETRAKSHPKGPSLSFREMSFQREKKVQGFLNRVPLREHNSPSAQVSLGHHCFAV